MDVLLHNKPWTTKIETSKGKQNFRNDDANVNDHADADISKWTCETTVATKVQVQEVESEHYSQNILSLLNSIPVSFL